MPTINKKAALTDAPVDHEALAISARQPDSRYTVAPTDYTADIADPANLVGNVSADGNRDVLHKVGRV